MRTIDADALIGPIKLQEESYRRCGAIERAEAYANCLWEIEQAPTVCGWISVMNRMPETNDEVLTTYLYDDKPNKRYVETASYFDDGDGEGHWHSVWDEFSIGRVRKTTIAWMPMPKPYKPTKEEIDD